MGIKRHKPEEIVTKLRQVMCLLDKGLAVRMRYGRLVSLNKSITAGRSNMVVAANRRCASSPLKIY